MNEAAYKIQLHTILDIAWVMFGVTLLSIIITGIIIPVRHLKKRIREEYFFGRFPLISKIDM